MIVGSGLIATSLRPFFAADDRYCVFAAGVSNSGCRESGEFAREGERLATTMSGIDRDTRLVYFGTCSAGDPDACGTPYVRHKLAMEALAARHGRTTVFRLPQVIGRTPNPHTLVNHLYARIARSERFTVWSRARRYFIHVDDMASIVHHLLVEEGLGDGTLDIANPCSHSIPEIVRAIERLTGKTAIYDAVDRGGDYRIDTARCEVAASRLGIEFGEDYLERALRRTYATRETGTAPAGGGAP